MSGFPGSGYYGHQYQHADQQRVTNGYAQAGNMAIAGNGAFENGTGPSGQTLDEIISQNNLEMMRRRTYQQPQYRHPSSDTHARRASMLEFGAPVGTDLDNFQFDPNPATSTLTSSIGDLGPAQKSLDPRKVRSREDLNVNTRFPPMNSSYSAFPGASSYSPALMSGVSMNLDPSLQYMPQPMDLSIDFENASGEVTPINMHSGNNQQPMFTDSPLEQNYPSTYPTSIQDPGGGDGRTDEQTQMERVSHMSMPDSRQVRTVRQDHLAASPVSTPQIQKMTTMSSPAHHPQIQSRRLSTTEPQNNFDTESKCPSLMLVDFRD